MARFKYKCPEHGEFTISLEKREKKVNCPQCNKSSRAIIRAGTIQVIERLDNGAMARAVERLHNVEEVLEERSENHSKMEKERMGIVEEEE